MWALTRRGLSVPARVSQSLLPLSEIVWRFDSLHVTRRVATITHHHGANRSSHHRGHCRRARQPVHRHHSALHEGIDGPLLNRVSCARNLLV